jgi:hypothetical protein
MIRVHAYTHTHTYGTMEFPGVRVKMDSSVTGSRARRSRKFKRPPRSAQLSEGESESGLSVTPGTDSGSESASDV